VCPHSLSVLYQPNVQLTLRAGFQLSTFVALVYITLTRPPSELYAVEAWLLVLFCIGGVASARGAGNSIDGEDLPPPSFSGYGASTIGAIIQFLLKSAVVFYALWFLYVGMDEMAHPPCSRAAFFFAKVDLYHWFRILLKVLFTLATAFYGFAVLATLRGILQMVQVNGLARAASIICGFNEEVAPATVHKGERRVTMLKDISFGVDLVVFILGTELVIRWNHISGVDSLGSTGQLLPLIVGGSELVRVLYKIIVKSIRRDYSESYMMLFYFMTRFKLLFFRIGGRL